MTTEQKAHPSIAMELGGRFKVLTLLKEGGNIETFLGEDLESGERVVIKATGSAEVTPGTRAHLEHEARILEQFDEPLIAPLVFAGQDGPTFFLVMRYVDGVTLKDRLAMGRLTAEEAALVGVCILGALQQIHDHGILHRDIKSSNVVVNEGAVIERATLIDFGLARTEHLHPSIRDQAVGTVKYMSPEAAGLIDSVVDERSDLYSVGVLLYEMLSGDPPFDGATVGDVLRQHLTEEPAELRTLGVEVPRAIEAVIERLLRKEPAARYQSADAALADLRDISKDLAKGIAEPAIVVGARDRRTTLTEPAFVGRKIELEVMADALERAAAGEDELVLIEAESGGGKTRLLQEFAALAARRGMRLLRGQGLDQAARRPFQVLTGVAIDIAHQAKDDPGWAEQLKESLGDQVEAVVGALPELSSVYGVETAEEIGPEEHGEFRSVRALAELLHVVGDRKRPALVVLDDCQWADDPTIKVLAHWLKSRKATPELGGTLVVAAFRSEEVAADHPLRSLSASGPVALPPLGASDLKALAESMAGELPQDVLDVVLRLSEGSPFMASAVLRGLVEAGTLIHGEAGWEVDPQGMADVRSSNRAAVFLSRRLSLLPPDTSKLLSVSAVLGKEFDLEMVARLTGETLAGVIGALQDARKRHVIWMEPRGQAAAFVHDKLRETVLGLLREDERGHLHLEAARAIEDTDPSRVFELAYHYDAGGEGAKALPYALAAAEQARSQHALVVAEQQYRIAERAAAGALEVLRQVNEGLGDVLMLRGAYDEAQNYLDAAVEMAEHSHERARLQGKLGELSFKRGDNTATERAIEAALSALGRRVPRSSWSFILMALWEVLVQVVHSLVPRLSVGRRSLDVAETDLLAARLYSRMAHAYWFGKGTIPTAWAHFKEMNIAERYPPTPELAQAYSEHAPVMTLVTYYKRGIKYARRSLAIRKSLGDVWGQGQSLHFYGVVLYGASRYRECIEKCREALRLLERTGDRWEMNTAGWHIALAHYRLGDLSSAVEVAKQVHASGSEIGDAQARGISLGAWSKASGGKVPATLIEAEMEASFKDVHTGAEVLQAEGVRLLGEGNPAEAVDVFAQARSMILRAGVLQEYVAPIFPWLVTGLRREAEVIPVWAPQRRNRLLRRARRASLAARLVAMRYRNNLPHALREAGLLAAARGRASASRRLLGRSLDAAGLHEAQHEYALSLQARGRVGLDLGWDGASEDLAEAQGLLAGFEVAEIGASTASGDYEEVVTPSFLDRFDSILRIGRGIASALSRDAVYAAVHEAALALLRGDRCQVFSVDPDGEATWVFGHEADKVSQTLIRRVLETGKLSVLAEDLPQDASDSLILTGIRSAICAPIEVRGKIEACFYVFHRQVGGLYGEEEQRLAEFIGTLAGAAIENADGFAEVQELTQSLEHRVDERTNELQEVLVREREARAESERRAGLLATVASAARVNTLDPDTVLETVVDSAISLGFDAADMCLLEEDRRTYRVVNPRGLPESYVRSNYRSDAGLVGRVMASGRTTVIDDYAELEDAVAEVGRGVFLSVIGSPLWSQGEIVGVLEAGLKTERKLKDEDVEAFELLAYKAGRALENARAFDEQRQTVERLGELDRLKDDFIATVSHELRTPLTVIEGMGTALETQWDDLDEAQALHLLSRINANAKALHRIIISLLDFSRVRGGHLELQPEEMDIGEFVKDLASRLGSLFIDRPLSVEVERGLVVDVDEALIDRVCENLMGNAAKHTPPGTKVVVSCRRDGDEVEFAVADDGSGIPASEIGHLTERFFRGTKVRSTRGLGLGLSLVEEILYMHGSQLVVESTEGEGARFSFRLPLKTSDLNSKGEEHSEKPEQTR